MLAVVLAIVITLPTWLGRLVPACAISLIAFGVLEHDGLLGGIGALVGGDALALSRTLVYSLFKAELAFLLGASARAGPAA